MSLGKEILYSKTWQTIKLNTQLFVHGQSNSDLILIHTKSLYQIWSKNNLFLISPLVLMQVRESLIREERDTWDIHTVQIPWNTVELPDIGAQPRQDQPNKPRWTISFIQTRQPPPHSFLNITFHLSTYNIQIVCAICSF